jgi:RimJ/RimL family protein N-acetyltransferase
MGYAVRVGKRADAAGIAEVHIASWRAGYAHVLPESLLYGDDFEPGRRRIWEEWRFHPGQRVAVCVEHGDDGDGDGGDGDGGDGDGDGAGDERIVGFAAFGPERERARGFTGRGELYAFYFHPDAWGSGGAGDLIRHVDDRLRAEGFAETVLWVLEDNPRARAFYEKHGWRPTGIGGEFDAYCEVQVPEIEYRKELS